MFPDIRFDYKWADEDFGITPARQSIKAAKPCCYIPAGGSAEPLTGGKHIDMTLPKQDISTMKAPANMNMEDEPDEIPKIGGV